VTTVTINVDDGTVRFYARDPHATAGFVGQVSRDVTADVLRDRPDLVTRPPEQLTSPRCRYCCTHGIPWYQRCGWCEDVDDGLWDCIVGDDEEQWLCEHGVGREARPPRRPRRPTT
jgi:hypothetical protein